MNIIQRLLDCETFPLTEPEVISLCFEARQSFLSQSMLLEVEAPINICGEFINSTFFYVNFLNNQQVTSMDNLMSFVGFLSLADRQIMAHVISFSVTMLIVVQSNSKLFVFSSPTKSNIRVHFSCCEATMRMQIFAVIMAF